MHWIDRCETRQLVTRGTILFVGPAASGKSMALADVARHHHTSRVYKFAPAISTLCPYNAADGPVDMESLGNVEQHVVCIFDDVDVSATFLANNPMVSDLFLRAHALNVLCLVTTQKLEYVARAVRSNATVIVHFGKHTAEIDTLYDQFHPTTSRDDLQKLIPTLPEHAAIVWTRGSPQLQWYAAQRPPIQGLDAENAIEASLSRIRDVKQELIHLEFDLERLAYALRT